LIVTVSNTPWIILSLAGPDVKFNAATFVAQNAGKLRDYYRIGKMLGSGTRSLFA
jgi:hypothetical protein